MEAGKQTHVESRPGGGGYAGRRIHLVGIGGSGMRALAEMLLERGAVVSGSDRCSGAVVERLRRQGATVRAAQRAENIPDGCELVVHSAAIGEQNPELVAARARGLEVIKYSQMLGRLMAERVGIAVAGTHGKSTTTAMVAYGLRAAGLEPSFIVGATVPQLGGPSGVGAGEHFVAEACEYDRSFLNLHPRIGVVLNVEEDHLDCYADLSAIVEAFGAFAALVPPEGVLVVNGEDRKALEAAAAARCGRETFGLAGGCTWEGKVAGEQAGRRELAVERAGEAFCRFRVPLPGLHNVYNALAAVAVLHHAGLAPGRIAEVLAGFEGAYRRMTVKGVVGGVTVLDDYAHHPTEIQATLRAIAEAWAPRRLICVFQPHQHSRTRFLLKDFARSFGPATEVIVPDIYFVRDSEREKDYISSQDLVAQIRLHGGSARYMRTFGEIVAYLAGALEAGDVAVTMGAGDIWNVADETVRRLERDR